VLAACHGRSTREGVAAVRQNGAYDYVARISGRSFTGVVHVVSDTLVVEASDGACWYDPGSVSTTTIRFRCEGPQDVGEFILVFDRHDPVSSSSWQASTYRDVKRRVCDKYSTDLSGRSTCTSSHIETEHRKESISGTLTIKAPNP
jgi:hypothetical protein